MGESVQNRSACPQDQVAPDILRPSATPQLTDHTPPYQMLLSVIIPRPYLEIWDRCPALQVSVLLADGTLHLSWQAPTSTCPLSEENLLQPLQRKWNHIQAHTAAPAVTEAVQKQNIRPTLRTNLQLPEQVVFLTHRMRTLHLDTLAKIHIKTKSLLILIISKLTSLIIFACPTIE